MMFSPKAAVTLCVLLFIMTQQVCAAPSSQLSSSSVLSEDVRTEDVRTLRTEDRGHVKRVARMTPLWRIMNSKPFGAYCQNNYECSTGVCRGGHCSSARSSSASEIVND